MTVDLSHNLEKLKHTFNNILLLRTDISNIKNVITTKINHLKSVYGELSKHTTKKALLFSLDSFFFQYKLFSVESESIDKLRILLNNRMYCDYYKLYTLIIIYIKDNTEDLLDETLEFRTFPVYKDLEPFQEYNIDDIKNIHLDIMKYINYLYRCYVSKRETILNYNKKTRIGFSISNLLNTLEHENTVLHHQMILFVNYLSFFHISQTKHLKKLLNQMNIFNEEIEENINGNHIYSVDDVEYNEPFREVETEEDCMQVSNCGENSKIIQTQSNISSNASDISNTSNILEPKDINIKAEPVTINITLTPDNDKVVTTDLENSLSTK
jgi:hypothetical protein